MRLAGVVLAAGGSKRFGDANKLLAPLNGQPLVTHALNTLEEAALDHRAIVLGHDAQKLKAAVKGFSGAVLANSDWESGMASSVHRAIDWARTVEASHLLVMLGDMPAVTADHIAALREYAIASPGSIVRATHTGAAGNPVIVPSTALEKLSLTTGDQGARAIIQEGFPTVDVALGSAVRLDVDTPEALSNISFAV